MAARAQYTLYVDEAGRGACVGDLVYAGLLVRTFASSDDDLDAIWTSSSAAAGSKRATDSKAMTPRARAAYFDAMLASCERVALAPTEERSEYGSCALFQLRSDAARAAFMTCSVSAQELTNQLLLERRRGVNLNTISYQATAQLVRLARAIVDGASGELAIVADRLGHDAASHEAGVARHVRSDTPLCWTRFTSEPRADANYKGVSIASVVAKVTRDRALGDDVGGGGYPNAACTRWLCSDAVHHPDARVRYSWDNLQVLLPVIMTDATERARYTARDDDDAPRKRAREGADSRA
jgi:ribonuclease HII